MAVGPIELILVLFVGIVSLLPVIASGVFLWLAYTGHFRRPTPCLKCGADVRG
jgi:hypothetical protein